MEIEFVRVSGPKFYGHMRRFRRSIGFTVVTSPIQRTNTYNPCRQCETITSSPSATAIFSINNLVPDPAVPASIGQARVEVEMVQWHGKLATYYVFWLKKVEQRYILLLSLLTVLCELFTNLMATLEKLRVTVYSEVTRLTHTADWATELIELASVLVQLTKWIF